jgi:sugar lactone lactonase YvrE
VSSYANYSAPFAFPLPANLSAPADMRLVAYCTHPLYLDSAIVSQEFRYVTNVPAPIITPIALPSYDYTVNSVPSVEITCAQPGASILRSIDGSPYGAYGAPFALPIPGDPLAESNVVVTAYATHVGYLDSSVATQTYHFIPTVPTPSIAPAPARYYQYNLPPTITLACSLAGVAIYSRVDGVSSDAAYLAPTPMPVPGVQTTSQNLTLRAYATKAGFVNSLDATMTYLFAASGSIVTIAGDGGSSYGGDGVDAVTVSLDNPEGVALDGTVALYIADTGRHRVRKVDLATGLITTFAGTSGAAGYAGNGGPATGALLSSPSSLVVDNNYVYICDRDNNCVRRVDKGTGVITTYVGAGPGSAGYNGDGGALASTWLNAPEAIALDSNDKNLYIADTANHRIRKIVIADSLVSTVAGNGTEGFSGDGNLAVNARLDHPRGIGVRLSNKFLYIGDADNHRVRVVDPDTGFIATVAGTGSPGYSGEGDPLSKMLSSPTRIAVDNAAVYISDTGNNRVRKLDGGVISTIAGTGTAGFSGEFNPASTAMISAPAGFIPTNVGFYLADRGNGRVRKILRY